MQRTSKLKNIQRASEAEKHEKNIPKVAQSK